MQELICSMCPNGCRITIEIEEDEVIVSGNGCMRGEAFARENGLRLISEQQEGR